jgi:hypothetical protein
VTPPQLVLDAIFDVNVSGKLYCRWGCFLPVAVAWSEELDTFVDLHAFRHAMSAAERYELGQETLEALSRYILIPDYEPAPLHLAASI